MCCYALVKTAIFALTPLTDPLPSRLLCAIGKNMGEGIQEKKNGAPCVFFFKEDMGKRAGADWEHGREVKTTTNKVHTHSHHLPRSPVLTQPNSHPTQPAFLFFLFSLFTTINSFVTFHYYSRQTHSVVHLSLTYPPSHIHLLSKNTFLPPALDFLLRDHLQPDEQGANF